MPLEGMNIKVGNTGIEVVCNLRIGFIGAGKMTTSLVKGLVKHGEKYNSLTSIEQLNLNFCV